MTLHWDGDVILFATDANGAVVDFKAGLDGEVTPSDANWPGLTVFNRDHSGTIVDTASNGKNYFFPFDAQDGGSPFGASSFIPQYVPYARSDGFTIYNVQISGVRAYDPALQTWTTPDAYEGDVHDPASQMKYTWNRNNAIDYSDPSGFCTTDDKKTGCMGGVDWKYNTTFFTNLQTVMHAVILFGLGIAGAGPRAAAPASGPIAAKMSAAKMSNSEAGDIIGWPKGQAGAPETARMATEMNRDAVQKMIQQGLTKEKVQDLLRQYQNAVDAGKAGVNPQLVPRRDLMQAILRNWPSQ